MSISLIKSIGDFVSNPTKDSINLLHSCMSYSVESHLKRFYVLIINGFLQQLRNMNDLSGMCCVELLYVLQRMDISENAKIYCVVLEETVTFIQNYVTKKQKTDDDEFHSFDDNIHIIADILPLLSFILSKSNQTKLELILYSPSSLLLMGYLVSFLLFCAESTKDKDNQKQALSALIDIAEYQVDCVWKKANLVVNFAPGMFQALTNIVKADRKIGAAVKSRALNCICKLTVLLYGDSSFNGDMDRLTIMESAENRAQLEGIITSRNSDWKRKSFPNVMKIMRLAKQCIMDRSDEEHWTVRRALLDGCLLVLKSCCLGCGAFANDLIDCIAVFTADVDSRVSATANDSIRFISDFQFLMPLRLSEDEEEITVFQSGRVLLASVIGSNIDKALDSMDSVWSQTDDGKCRTLQRLDAYLGLYDSGCSGQSNYVHLQRTFANLVRLCTMDHLRVDLLDQAVMSGDEIPKNPTTATITIEFFKKRFVHFHSDSVYRLIESIMGRLCRMGSPSEILSLLRSEVDENRCSSIGPVLLLIKMAVMRISCLDTVSINDKVNICRVILSEYFDGSYMNLETTVESNSNNPEQMNWFPPAAATIAPIVCSSSVVTSSFSDQLSPSDAKSNSLTIALIMELCAACSLCIKRCLLDDDIDVVDESWIMRICLFHVMSKVYQPPALVTQSGLACLMVLAEIHNKYKRSVCCLLRLNADYVMDAVARRFRFAAICLKMQSSRSLDVDVLLKVRSAGRCMMTLCVYADHTITPFLDTIIGQLLVYLDEAHPSNKHILLPVLGHVVKAVVRWIGPSLISTVPIAAAISDVSASDNSLDMIRTFLHKRNDVLISSGVRNDPREPFVNVSAAEDDEMIENYEEDNSVGSEVKTPPTIEIILKISDRCINLLSSTNIQVRLLCLDMMNNVLFALQSYKDLLNQTIHKLWQPLEFRFNDKEYPVVIKAFELLNTASQLSGDFLFVKIRGSLVSQLCSILENCANISISPTATMKYTGLYKTQINLLMFLSHLCIRTDYSGSGFERVVDTFLLYLNDRQPVELIQACEKSLGVLFKFDPGLVWYKVAQIVVSNPDCQTNEHKIFGQMTRSYNSHYYSNASNFLHTLE